MKVTHQINIQTDIILMFDNIYVEFGAFGGPVHQQNVGIPMGTNCAPLVADLVLHVYSYEADFVQYLQKSCSRSKKHPLISLFT